MIAIGKPWLTRHSCDRGVADSLADGRMESHSATIDRLIDTIDLSRKELCRPKIAMIADSLERRDSGIDYAEKKLGLSATRH